MSRLTTLWRLTVMAHSCTSPHFDPLSLTGSFLFVSYWLWLAMPRANEPRTGDHARRGSSPIGAAISIASVEPLLRVRVQQAAVAALHPEYQGETCADEDETGAHQGATGARRVLNAVERGYELRTLKEFAKTLWQSFANAFSVMSPWHNRSQVAATIPRHAGCPRRDPGLGWN
jgi:hypothetical protein